MTAQEFYEKYYDQFLVVGDPGTFESVHQRVFRFAEAYATHSVPEPERCPQCGSDAKNLVNYPGCWISNKNGAVVHPWHGMAEPPARKDELGTEITPWYVWRKLCNEGRIKLSRDERFNENQWDAVRLLAKEFANATPVAPQASPEAPLILHKLRNPMDCTDDCPACAKEAPAKEDEQVGTLTLETVLKELDYCGIHFDAELAAEGAGWASAAEPEPQYFETLREAIGFQISLTDPIVPPVAGKDWLESQEFYELMQTYRISPLTKQRQVYASYEAVKSAIRARLGLSGRAE